MTNMEIMLYMLQDISLKLEKSKWENVKNHLDMFCFLFRRPHPQVVCLPPSVSCYWCCLSFLLPTLSVLWDLFSLKGSSIFQGNEWCSCMIKHVNIKNYAGWNESPPMGHFVIAAWDLFFFLFMRSMCVGHAWGQEANIARLSCWHVCCLEEHGPLGQSSAMKYGHRGKLSSGQCLRSRPFVPWDI